MTWTKLSDDFSDDCWRLSDAAFRLHVEGLVWSNRKLLDLRLDKDEVRRWAKNPEAIEELLACDWWEDRGEHYLINHHAIYQRSRDAVLRQQAANQSNARKPRRPGRERAVPSDSLSDSHSEMDGTGRDWPGRESDQLSSDSLAKKNDGWPAWRGSGPDPFEDYK
jgi:hypothetical protein